MLGKLEGKRPQGRLRNRLENNIQVDLMEIQWEDVSWDLNDDVDRWLPVVNKVVYHWIS